eukprot:COSAG06_NODE_1616_length_8924_cov_9.604419_4_plen_89_part_00
MTIVVQSCPAGVRGREFQGSGQAEQAQLHAFLARLWRRGTALRAVLHRTAVSRIMQQNELLVLVWPCEMTVALCACVMCYILLAGMCC